MHDRRVALRKSSELRSFRHTSCDELLERGVDCPVLLSGAIAARLSYVSVTNTATGKLAKTCASGIAVSALSTAPVKMLR